MQFKMRAVCIRSAHAATGVSRPGREETIAALDRSVRDLGPLEARRLL
jgi:hypothetical protein